MPAFSERSLRELETCHPDLQWLMKEVVKGFDIAVLEGFRSRRDQMEAYRQGRSHIRWPHGKHNKRPSLAVDVAPWKPHEPHIDWHDIELFRAMGGYVIGLAFAHGIEIRWGGDWDGDWDFRDQRLHDLPHFEIILTEESDEEPEA